MLSIHTIETKGRKKRRNIRVGEVIFTMKQRGWEYGIQKQLK